MSTETIRIKEIKKIQESQLKILFDGAIPIFLAAIVTDSVSTLISAMTYANSISLRILISFIYAVFIASSLSYYVGLRFTPSWNLFPFWFRFALENSSFGWNNAASLLVVDTSSYGLIYGFLTWIAMAISVILLLYVSNWLQFHILHQEHQKRLNILTIETEAYVLLLTYSLTSLWTSILYQNEIVVDNTDTSLWSTNYGITLGSLYLTIYAIGITAILIYIQINFNIAEHSELIIEAEKLNRRSMLLMNIKQQRSTDNLSRPSNQCTDLSNAENSAQVPSLPTSESATIHNTQQVTANRANSNDLNAPILNPILSSVDVKANDQSNGLSTTPTRTQDDENRLPLQDATLDEYSDTRSSYALRSVSLQSNNSMSDRFSTAETVTPSRVSASFTNSLLHLGTVFLGYLVGCAWFFWSTLILQGLSTLFNFGNSVGLLVYALVVTYITSRHMTKIALHNVRIDDTLIDAESINHETSTFSNSNQSQQSLSSDFSPAYSPHSATNSTPRYITHATYRRIGLLLIAGRLVVGYAWDQFFFSLVNNIRIASRSYNVNLWVEAGVKFLISAVAVIIAVRVELYRQNLRRANQK